MTSLFAFAQVRLMDTYASIRDREDGQGMAEYAFLIVGVVAMVAAVVGILTTSLGTKIQNVISGL